MEKTELYAEDLAGRVWRKSSHSNPHNCVEVTRIAGGFALRDSKNPEKDALRFTPGEMEAFVRGWVDAEF